MRIGRIPVAYDAAYEGLVRLVDAFDRLEIEIPWARHAWTPEQIAAVLALFEEIHNATDSFRARLKEIEQ